ncbi:hypothetical protein [Rodentibacter genomosp. 2]|uniref:hypothetical protein n=1 Tax=Rodentibacter genomosp. 2 TaxID=1908266 RepID=UPI00269B033B|nr:hypothetical protein [Rodentibacter genomosp. 2]
MSNKNWLTVSDGISINLNDWLRYFQPATKYGRSSGAEALIIGWTITAVSGL